MLKKLLYGLIVISLLFLGLSRLLNIGDGSLEIVASHALYPFLLVQKAVRTRLNNWYFHRQSAQELARELEHYLQLHEKLQQELIELKALTNYKDLTEDVRDFLKKYSTKSAQLAQVLLKHFDKNHFFLIDAGAKKGVTKDMIAVYKDCLIGRVIEVYPYYSKVMLVTDPACKVAALCTANNVKGIHEGARLDVTKLSFVDYLQDLKEGDLILSSGEGLVFPRGFGLGRIKHWERDGYNYLVTVEPLLNFKKIDYCYLIPGTTELIESPATSDTTKKESPSVS